MTSKLMESFNRTRRIGVLSTAAADGTVDVAVFGSPQMTDERTVTLGWHEPDAREPARESARRIHDYGIWAEHP